MTVQAIATTLLLPPLGLVLATLLAAAAAFCLRRHRRRLSSTVLWAVVAAAALGQLVLATPYVSGHLRASLQSPRVATPPPSAGPEAIIVLGAETAHGQAGVTVGPLSLERLRAGAALARRTGLPVLVTGGRLAPSEPPIAALMAATMAEDFGITPRWIEPQAGDTAENAAFSARMLRAEGVMSAHVVTHAWHMARALEAFERSGFIAHSAPVRLERRPSGLWSDFIPRTDHLHESWLMLREWAGRLVYALRDGSAAGPR
jgi:uncharacterized SAM-binding protein YcdF (DUF218 family)